MRQSVGARKTLSRGQLLTGRMSGYFVCPYCRATVQPTVGADGRKTCPQCRNTGVRSAPPAAPQQPQWAPAGHAGAPGQGPPAAPGAIASLVCGIVGVLTAPIGLVLGIIAIVLARKAEQEVAARPTSYSGLGMAQAGRILGIVSIAFAAVVVVVMVMAFAAFMGAMAAFMGAVASVQAASFSVDAGANQLVVTQTVGDHDWSEFTVSGSAGCVLPSGSVDVDDVVQCASDGTVLIERDGETVFEGEV